MHTHFDAKRSKGTKEHRRYHSPRRGRFLQASIKIYAAVHG